MAANEYLEKLRSIGVVGKNVGKPRVGVTKAEGSTVIETEHWDGRQDATVRPATVRYSVRAHTTGKKQGEVAEISKMSKKERTERYGE
jgi:hypothetical protein